MITINLHVTINVHGEELPLNSPGSRPPAPASSSAAAKLRESIGKAVQANLKSSGIADEILTKYPPTPEINETVSPKSTWANPRTIPITCVQCGATKAQKYFKLAHLKFSDRCIDCRRTDPAFKSNDRRKIETKCATCDFVGPKGAFKSGGAISDRCKACRKTHRKPYTRKDVNAQPEIMNKDSPIVNGEPVLVNKEPPPVNRVNDGLTHFIGDDCPGGHQSDLVLIDEDLKPPPVMKVTKLEPSAGLEFTREAPRPRQYTCRQCTKQRAQQYIVDGLCKQCISKNELAS